MIKRQVDHMVHLVDDLLDMARLSEGKVELRRSQVRLDEVVKDAVEMSMPLVNAGEHQLSLALPELPILLHVDRHRIAQVLSNLVNNAAKYTPRGGRIAVQAQSREGEIVLSVTDNGIGIAADMLPVIFDMYAQVHDNAGMAQGGLGVGLNLVKRLVELHGGQVRAESAGLQQGSRFTVSLPLDALQAPDAGSEHAAASRTDAAGSDGPEHPRGRRQRRCGADAAFPAGDERPRGDARARWRRRTGTGAAGASAMRSSSTSACPTRAAWKWRWRCARWKACARPCWSP